MSAVIGFPVKTVFSDSGTYTSDQNTIDVDASDVRKLMVGVNVSSLTGSSGVDVSVGGKGPDGNYYELGRISNLDGAGIVRIEGPIPGEINVGLGLNGASSASLSYWVIGQA